MPIPTVTADRAQQHRRPLWRFARVLGCDPDEADDLVQEAFVRADAAERNLLPTWSGDGSDRFVDAVRHCVAALSGRAATIVDRFYRNGESRAAIARDLRMTENGVKTALQRARAHLRQCIERRTR